MNVAIDFTESNKIVSDPQSLHFLSDHLNSYEQAIFDIGVVLE